MVEHTANCNISEKLSDVCSCGATHASDCATHNGLAAERGTDIVEWLRAASNVLWTEAPVPDRLQVAADVIERSRSALRSARALIASHRDNDLECYTVSTGDPTVMDDAERAAIAEYDVVLAQIDEVLNG
jgi:hypothetical protein